MREQEKKFLKAIARQIRADNENTDKVIEERVRSAFVEVGRLEKKFLEADPHLRRLYLFGSLAEDRVSRESFDIDLAVDSDKYLEIVGLCFDSDFKVDLVDLKTIHQFIRAHILSKGKLLYEKN